ncbi:aspartic peptidase domain-containing protein [Dactylonectria estremocensis]|uniref:Aspartic peptidase domain-containing protein n=1 Tax=Dactylonectria estremocensis TaxID=1079267 RepID=A0A9P9FD74_9HYPO|nr:aspartic peptidase domain-containing protein [Dactylonectria estremocensis]
MRSLPLLSLAATCASAGTVSVDFSRFKLDLALSITKRDTLNLKAINNITGGGYYAEFEIGTPGQKIGFLLDTGSSDTWVNSIDTDLCNSVSLQETNGYCMTSFNPDDSDTFKTVDQGGFDITYLDTRRIRGDYFNDTVTIGGKEITNQKLGLATRSVRPTGIMGLGFPANVAADSEYPTVLNNMVSQGYINTNAFSLYLNDLSASSGTILFGGIDKAKFVGSLTTLPLQSDFQSLDNNITSFTVEMDSFKVTKDGDDMSSVSSFSAKAILDSGSTICLLPASQTNDLWDAFDVRTVTGLDVPFVDCAYANSKGDGIFIDFTFGDKTISVPMNEMVVDSFASIQDQIMNDSQLSQIFDGWEGACMFGVASAADYGVTDSDFALLGDTFLRSAYVVYDLDNEQIGLAEANTNTSDSDIVELKAGDSDFPNVTGVASSSNNDDDSAARQLAPALVASLMMAVGAAVIML